LDSLRRLGNIGKPCSVITELRAAIYREANESDLPEITSTQYQTLKRAAESEIQNRDIFY